MVRQLLATAALAFASSVYAAKGVPPAPQPADQTARTVFQVLVSEMALQRGAIDLGVSAYVDLARRTRDPGILERAIEVAGYAKQFDAAHDLARLWVEVQPASPKARQTLAALLVLLNRTDELAPQLTALLEQDKENLGDNLLRINRMLVRHPDRQAVQRLVERITAPYSDLPEAHFALATAAANAGDAARARSEVDTALKLRPDWEAAALLRTQFQAQASVRDAIAGLEDFVSRHPSARESRLTLARLLIAEKRYDEARRHFDHLLQDSPDSPEITYPAAMLALQQGDLKTGKARLERLLQSDFADKSTLHFFLGQISEEEKQAEAALDHYRQVTAGDQFIPARARAAQVLAQQGRFDEARHFVSTASGRTDQERTQLALAESQLLREQKQYEDAYAVLQKALGSQPDNLDLLYDAALMAERIGRLEALEAHLQHLLKLKPDHAHGLNALGYSWAERNIRLPEAHGLVTRALELAPDDPFIMDSLGWVLYRQGKLEEALKVLDRAYRSKPDPEIAAHLSEVLWALGRKDEARRVLKEASHQHPDNEVLSAAARKFQP